MADIAGKAGCSVGAVYHHFKDKQALLYALTERMVSESKATMEQALDPERWQGATLMDIFQGYLEFSLTEGRGHTRFKAALLDVARQDEEIANQLQTLFSAKRFITLLLTRQDEVGHKNPELALKMVLDQISALLRDRLGESPYDMYTGGITDDEFMDEVLTSSSAYLQIKT